MSGDYVALNFEYFAETWFDIQQSGQTTDVNDYAAITADWTRSDDYSGLIYGQWNDYNEDGFCIVDEDEMDSLTQSTRLQSTTLKSSTLVTLPT